MQEYIRISTGLDNYTLLKRSDLNLEEIIKSAGDQDKYYGIYVYEEEHYQKWSKERTLKGIRDVTTDKIVFDIDNPNLETARKSTLDLIDLLVLDGIDKEKVNIYFSGNKGFHVILTITNRIDRKTYESILKRYKQHVPEIDTSVKDQQRLIRMPFTKNDKSGLYDIPLSYEELNSDSIDTIKDKAKTLDEDRFQSWNIKYIDLPEELTIEEKKPEKPKVHVDGLDLSKKPSWLSSVRYALKEGYFEEGERNTACMILAATYKNNGIDSEECFQLLKRTLEKRKSLYEVDYSEDELRLTVVDYVYSDEWRGGQYTEENDLLQKVADRLGLDAQENTSNLIRFNEGIVNFKQLSKGWRDRLITTGIDIIDQNVMIEKGMMVGLLGSPGSGKTSFALNFAENLSKNNKYTLFMSLDMPYLKVIGRMLQKQLARSGSVMSLEKIQDTFDSGVHHGPLVKAQKYCDENYSKILFDNSDESDLNSIEKNIEQCKQQYGNDFSLVIIDYFEKIRGKFENDPTTSGAHIASRLSGLAKRYDVAILVLLQPRKSAGDPRKTLDNYTDIKGSSTIPQDSRVIMTMWRPGYDPKENNINDKYASIAVVKANLGEQCQMNFAWNGFSGTLTDLSFDQKVKLEKLLERNKRLELNNRYGY